MFTCCMVLERILDVHLLHGIREDTGYLLHGIREDTGCSLASWY